MEIGRPLRTFLQPLCAGQLGKIPVEGAQRKMTSLSSHLKHKAVREATCGFRPLLFQSSGDRFSVLNGPCQPSSFAPTLPTKSLAQIGYEVFPMLEANRKTE